MAIPLDQATLDSLSITDSYSEPMGMAYLFELIDLNQNERDHLVCDGFYSIQDFVALYKYDHKKLERYLLNLNKTFATAPNNRRLYFTPNEINMIIAVLHCFGQCVNTLQKVPDVAKVDIDFLSIIYDHYASNIESNDDVDNDGECTLPKLEGHKIWISWRDIFTSNVDVAKGARGIPIDYIGDQMERSLKRSNANLVEVDVVDFNDDSIQK